MERIRQLIQNIGNQLGVLSGSQRLAIALCAALIVVSLMWLMQWSTSPPMVPLVTHDFTYEQIESAEQALRDGGVKFDTRGMKIFVNGNDRYNAKRLLHVAGALPEGSLFDMESVVKDSNPFQSPEARQYAQNYAKGNELAKIIATSPFVSNASVIINPITKRRLGGITDVPTASVTVSLMPGKEISADMAKGFAKLVTGAVAGLKPQNVSVLDGRTLRSYTVPDPNDAASFDTFALVQQREQHYRNKILSKLGDIPGLQVEVTVELDRSKRVTQNIKHDSPALKMEKTDAADRSTSQRATEPGVQANLGQALTAGGAGQASTTEKTTTENFEPKLTQTETIEQMPFAVKKVTASVGIPRSFLIGVFHALYPDAEGDPKDDEPRFVTVREAQVRRVKESVALIVMARAPEDVSVDVYPDMEWNAQGGVWSRTPGAVRVQQEARSFDAMSFAQTYGPQIGLAVLAIVSLSMMLRIVKRSAELIGPSGERGTDADETGQADEMLNVVPAPVGKAAVSKGMLIGHEVDSEALRYQEIGEEVSKMVEEDPNGTAALLRRWIDDTQ